MATLEEKPILGLEVMLRLNAREVRALAELSGWKNSDIVIALGKLTGDSYLAKHNTALLEFFDAVRRGLPVIVHRFDHAVAAFKNPPPHEPRSTDH